MKFSGPTTREAALLVIGAVALSAEWLLRVEGHRAVELHSVSRGHRSLLQTLPESAEVHTCREQQRDGAEATKQLELNATVGESLQFQCGASEELRPAGSEGSNYDKFYGYTPGEGCDPNKEMNLADQKINATLVKLPAKQRAERQPGVGPVYAFTYSSEPEDEKHLCYTCNTTTQSLGYRTGTSSTQEKAACTVHITVPRKATTTPVPTTMAPNSTSDACPMTAFISTAIGGLVTLSM